MTNSEFSRCAETFNDVEYPLRHFVERLQNRLTLDNLRLVERYIKQELHFLVHFRARDGKEFIACLHRDTGKHFKCSTHETGLGLRPRNGLLINRSLAWREALAAGRGTGREEQTMLVNLVKFMEFPEQEVSTLVWLEGINEFYRRWPNTLYFSTKFNRLVLRGGLSYRETCLCRNSAPPDSHEVAGKMVKSAPEIEQNIPRNQRNFGWNLGHMVDVRNTLLNVRIVLKPDEFAVITGWSGECSNDSVQLVDVLFGPFDL